MAVYLTQLVNEIRDIFLTIMPMIMFLILVFKIFTKKKKTTITTERKQLM